MISALDQVFHISTESYSYLFQINRHGMPEHLHFGEPILTEDWQAMCCKSGLGWGSSIILDEKDPGSCPDIMPLEFSGNGRGDYRESSIEINGKSVDFKFVSSRIFKGIAPMTQGLPQAKGGEETLEIVLEQPGSRLKFYYTAFETVLTRRAVLENTGDSPLQLNKLMSFCVDIFGDFEMTSFHGNWIAEMRPHRQPVSGGRVVNESTTGFSSFRHQPGFLLSAPNATEEYGVVYGFNLVYSGNHYASCQQSFQGLTRVVMGINPSNFIKLLDPGEIFETPEAVLTWSDDGFNGISSNFHQFINRHIVPEYWQLRERPVLFNSWEGCMFNFTHSRLVDLAKRAKKLGCELFVLDDGWFGKRDNDLAGLGDYNVNYKKLPEGLKGLADKINSLGMEFGLWFEPEAVNPDSDLYRAHPDWALTDDHPDIYGRHELLLDLTKQEVRDYIVENVSRVLDSANISYVKWDMNRHSIALGGKAHDYILGLYDVLGRIFGPRPHILLESCSSGGNRFDLGMLCYSPQVWCSDDTDPIERLTIQGSLSYLYPQSTFGAHVSAAPHAQTLRTTPLNTRGNVSFFGCLGYELDLKHLLGVEEKEVIAQTAFYKEYRMVFQYGSFRRVENKDAVCWQVKGENSIISGLFHRLQSAAPGYEKLRVIDLDRQQRYHVISRAQKLRIGVFGNLVKHIAPMDVDPNGVLLRTVDHHLMLDDGTEEITASGAALHSGVMLHNRFAGTGYNKEQRTQGDFGSNVYVVTPVE